MKPSSTSRKSIDKNKVLQYFKENTTLEYVDGSAWIRFKESQEMIQLSPEEQKYLESFYDN